MIRLLEPDACMTLKEFNMYVCDIFTMLGLPVPKYGDDPDRARSIMCRNFLKMSKAYATQKKLEDELNG